ncbi:MAG TPA: catalase [Casimicrobiaceae bacterium]|nr:catalase [Casimicrobiaceae bacterium]
MTSARSTVGGPSKPDAATLAARDAYVSKMEATQGLAEGMPFNANKPNESGEAARAPQPGATVEADDPAATGSTLTEVTRSPKVGSGEPPDGVDPGSKPLDRVRADSRGRMLTTNQGVFVGDNQNSLKAGLRGPALLEDFILREKITHFDHERIPERVVHARGSGAHGFFECFESLAKITRASIFAEAGKRTPVFVRFSTVLGERGSTDTARDVRGFAVKFYTDEGNWDLVGNNLPVFFIQDAMKFPDLVHAAKPEPHFQMPQAGTAHDTFWDFISLMPESAHMIMWAMSDRAIPRSFRMMQGFGVHTFRFVNANGVSQFVKFHWNPKLGTHSLVWDEAVKISGADSDFHRRDLWEAIEGGAFPEWELGVQLFSEEEADGFTFDVLDATKIVPEELVPVRPIGRMVLNRNPDNFFAETEQVAFCTAHIVPGIDFTNDPLLAGRIHSYVDTQISRLGGPNFHELPINAPIAPVHNNQRDGMHRQAIHRGRVAYEPNSLGGGCPFQSGMRGFTSFPEPIADDKVRGKPEKFADHYSQATLFYRSQTPVEQAHIVGALRFELTKVQVPAVRSRVVAMLRNIDEDLAGRVCADLGLDLPDPLPLALDKLVQSEVDVSPALSLTSRPGDGGIATRRIAIIVGDGVDTHAAMQIHSRLSELGAMPRYIGAKLGTIEGEDGETIDIEATLETMPSVLVDAIAIPGGKPGVDRLGQLGQAGESIVNAYRHCKPILALGAARALVENAGVPSRLPNGEEDPGLHLHEDEELEQAIAMFVEAIAKHRHFEREVDLPAV